MAAARAEVAWLDRDPQRVREFGCPYEAALALAGFLARARPGASRHAAHAALVVSERTVDHHVSAILRKLDVRTRAQATREATRRELTA